MYSSLKVKESLEASNDRWSWDWNLWASTVGLQYWTIKIYGTILWLDRTGTILDHENIIFHKMF